ncbi:hypothetical protein AC578_9759 [Pseudocercospora eumusae]|uniref:Uncharacterized protein n=1 Tax=Pseudocercospora eumusae TaxID=321146 RepID=A0A139HQM3_9PEZI|nr:hypothetical protein AC578_9759 [Pseudocercospora eumusae]
MSRETSSTEDIFDGLLRPDEEAHVDELMEEMTGDAVEFDYEAWQSTMGQKDVLMIDAADEDPRHETRQSETSTGTVRYASTFFQENSTTPALPNHAHTSAPEAGTTQQASASQEVPSFSRQPSMPQATSKQSATNSKQPRPKWKAREASNAAPTFPRGTWDVPVLTCTNEIKRPDGEFRLHGNHAGNQKCAQILKAIFPEKFPATHTNEVLATRVAPVWNDRDRGKKAEWDRVRGMREEDEQLREEMRAKIRATGLV